MDKTSATIKVGDSDAFTATVTPDEATDKTVTWSSSDGSVATVVNGVVTGIVEGSPMSDIALVYSFD
ncbi:MAG: Ig-like domain-containing protein [Ruminococcus sp.]|nr:Ig-like domain-containing protein [Ruminococcus sp.]